MSEQNQNPDAVDDEQPEGSESAGIRNLREENKRLADEAKAGKDAQRTLAFMQAGVDTSSKVAQRLMETYDGALTAEDVSAFALELELVKPPADPGDEAPKSQTQERRNLSAESAEPAAYEPPDVSPILQGFEEYHEARKTGTSKDDASAAIFGKILEAAANGDERTIFDPAAHREKVRLIEGE